MSGFRFPLLFTRRNFTPEKEISAEITMVDGNPPHKSQCAFFFFFLCTSNRSYLYTHVRREYTKINTRQSPVPRPSSLDDL